MPPLKVVQYIYKYIFLIIKNKFTLLINEKDSGYFEILIYFEGTKVSYELIMLDWLNVFSKFSSILSAITCLDELLITSLFLATAFKQ